MSTVETIRKPRNSEKIGDEIKALTAERTTAELRLTELQATWQDVLLQDDDAKASAHEAETAKQKRAIERCNLKIAPLEAELSEAIARETQKARRAKYEDAQKLAAETAKFVRIEHEKIRQKIFNFFETLAKAEIAVEEANAELPEGGLPIQGVEEQVRCSPAQPRRVISEEEFEEWCDAQEMRPLFPSALKSVSKDFGNPSSFVYLDALGQPRRCVKRKFRRTIYRPDIRGNYPPALWGVARWPDLHIPAHVHGSSYAGWQRPDSSAVLSRIAFERGRSVQPEEEALPESFEEITPIRE